MDLPRARSGGRTDRPRRRGRSAAHALLATAFVASCASSGDDMTGHAHQHATAVVAGQPDRPIAGPQGDVPQFVVECDFSHAAQDDPIVHFGDPGASHLHNFFGNETTDASSTLATLEAGSTTCDQQLDRASYWAPALLLDGVSQQPLKSTAYYRAGLDVDPTTVQAYPPGFTMIAGSAGATDAQPASIVAWTCGTGIGRDIVPPACPIDRNLRLIVTFPDCWDGVHLDSEDHVSHVAYSSGGRCPQDQPVPIPQLQFSVEYPVTGPTAGLVLASGGLLTGHADFYNAWDQDKLEREVAQCLHRLVICGVTSGRKTG